MVLSVGTYLGRLSISSSGGSCKFSKKNLRLRDHRKPEDSPPLEQFHVIEESRDNSDKEQSHKNHCSMNVTWLNNEWYYLCNLTP